MKKDKVSLPVETFVSALLGQEDCKISSTKISTEPPGPNSIEFLRVDEEMNSGGSFSRLLPISLIDGYGEYVRDVDGNVYRDHFSGATAANLGYGLTAFTKEIIVELIKQALSIQHVPYMYLSNPPATMLAQKLLKIASGRFDKVAFATGGSSANDYAIKMARSFTKKKGLITFENAFHGNTFGAASVSGFNLLSEKTGDIGNIFRVPFPKDETTAIRSLKLTEKYLKHRQIGGMFIETIQADSGVLIPPLWYFKQLRALCDKHGVLIIDDEVQTGLGRTGAWFAFEHFNFVPDVITLGKGLSGGFIPMGAVITRKEIADAAKKPQLITTFLGHPIGSVVSLGVINAIEKLLPAIKSNGRYIEKLQNNLIKKYKMVKDARGLGYLRAIEVSPETGALSIFRALEKGEIFGLFGIKNEVIRDAPPLTMTRRSLSEGYKKLEECFIEIEKGKIPKSTIEKVNLYFKGML